MKRILSFFLSLFISSSVFISTTTSAQEADMCGFEKQLQEQLVNDEHFKAYVENFDRRFLRRLKENPNHAGERLDVKTIPLVFHIVHIGEAVGTGSNITDEQIESAVEGLNIHFRNKNEDGSAFHANGVDTEIEFCLAQVDPDGNATTGIRRVDFSGNATYVADGVGNPGITNGQLKAAPNFWDNRDYYNVWVVWKINGTNGGGTQGYAMFAPPGYNAQDGTVVLFNTCGFDPDGSRGHNLKSFTRDGGTMTHEIGHALNLYHTFQGDNPSGDGATFVCPAQQNGCGGNNGDCLSDTAPHKRNNSTCNPGGGNVCFGENMEPTIYNWMDYSSCPDRFSAMQKTRMRETFVSGARSNYDEGKCIPVYLTDAEIINIKYPISGNMCSESFDPVITLKNRGANTLTSVDIEYYVDAETPQVYNWTGTLLTGTTTEITLPTYTTTAGLHTFFVNSTNPNGTTDEYTGNDSKNLTFDIIDGTEVHLRIVLFNNSSLERWKITQGGTTIASGTYPDGQGGTTIDEYICLPNECYKFEFTNDYGGVFGSSNYTLKDDQGNVIASGLTPNGSGSPQTETTDFCLPFDPGFIHADFEADQTIVASGTFVDFTDKSYSVGTPAQTWSWEFNDGTPNATNQNPSHPFTTQGLYDITLAVTNDIDEDTLTKKGYIKVYDPVTSCTVLNNKLFGAEPTPVQPVPSTWGYFAGHNGKNVTGYADVHFSNGTSNVLSLDVSVEKVHAALPNNTVTFNVYGNSNGLPSSVLASKTVKLSDLSVGMNNIMLDQPYAVSGIFHIGYEIDYTYPDTLVVGSAAHRGEGEYNSMFALKDGNWKPVSDIFGDDARSSLDIDVKLSFIPSIDIELGDDIVCLNSNISFDGRNSTYETSYDWEFEDGVTTSGNTSSGLGSVKFTSSGQKKVKLTVTGGCNVSISDSTTIKVVDKPDITLNAIDESCGGGNGSITAEVVGGSGIYTYLWDDPQNQITRTAVQLTGGRSYEVTVNDGVCPAVKESISIDNSPTLPAFGIDAYHTTCGASNGLAVANPIGGTGNFTYRWTDPLGQTTKSAVDLAPGTYTVFVNDGQCPEASQTVTIEGSQPVFATAEASKDSLCENELVMLTASGGESYIWEDQFGQNIGTGDTLILTPGYTDTYTVTVFEGNCVGTASVDVNVTTRPTAFASVNGQTNMPSVEMDNCGRANFSSSGSLGINFHWDFGDGNQSFKKSPLHYYEAPGNYTAILTVSIGTCSETKSLNVTVNPASIYADILGGDVSICPGGSLYLTGTSNNGNSYSWNDGVSDFANGSQILVAPDSTTTYTVTAKDECGNEATKSTTITVYDSPTVTINTSIDSVDINDGGIISFFIDSTSNAISYLWNINGDIFYSDSVDYAFTEAGTYTVTLTGYSVNQCEKTVEKTVVVTSTVGINETSQSSLDVVVYPNPTNGVFQIKGNLNHSNSVKVFDARGSELNELRKTTENGIITIDLSSYSDGIYFVKVGNTLKRVTLNR